MADCGAVCAGRGRSREAKRAPGVEPAGTTYTVAVATVVILHRRHIEVYHVC